MNMLRSRSLTLVAALFVLAACSDEPSSNNMKTNNDSDLNNSKRDMSDAGDMKIPTINDMSDMGDMGDMSTPALSVTQTQPQDNAQEVAFDAPVVFSFSEAIDPASVDASVLVIEPAVEGTIALDQAQTSISFTHEPFAPETTYKITLKATVRAKTSARALAQDRSVTFKTKADGPIVNPDDTHIYVSGNQRATVSIADRDSATRTYTMETTAQLRDSLPADKRMVFSELSDQPIVRSGHDIFDALFALAMEEVRLDSVSSIRDGAFNNGQGVPCECFETGEKWNYVWTRDTAYAVDLGLALVDPERAMRSLDFKLSALKSGGGLQIVQDTGSGGSYPVSTDRVVWAIGAQEVLNHLPDGPRAAFAAKTLDALKNTIEQDRLMVYDSADGLYRGEQSFLDWREQSYPSWTKDDTVHLGMSKSLSTNVGHYAILDIAATLATEAGQAAQATRYRQWADALKGALSAELWLEDVKQFSALKTTALDPAPLHKYDLLGTSLAILRGVATPTQGLEATSSYPHTLMGPPVLWPQQPLTPIYHNRGIWPFVTAYGALAARHVGNAAVFDHDMASLIRGAALNLSNMENFEFLTQQAWVEDGPYSGPVVNSRRQLWSVAGYLGGVIKGVFGFEATAQGVRVRPFITSGLHRDFFKGQTLELRQLQHKGKRVTIKVKLPTTIDANPGVYSVASVTLNGQSVDAQAFIPASQLMDENTFEVTLGALVPSQGEAKIVQGQDFKLYWSPRDPNLEPIERVDGKLQLRFDSNGEDGVSFNIYRDGERVAQNVQGPTWQDSVTDFDQRTYCYSVEAVFNATQNHSHHAKPQCDWAGGRIQNISVLDMMASPQGTWSRMYGQPHYSGWGTPQDSLEVAYFKPNWSGAYGVQAVYGNGAGSINTGITASVKRLIIEELGANGAPNAQSAQEGYLVMPHLASWMRWMDSSIWPVQLDASKLYRVRLVDGINMSYFAHFVPYTGGQGGGADTYNFSNITNLKFLPMQGQPAPRSAGDLIALDGAADFDKFSAAQQLTPGVVVNPWSRFALTWDADYLYVSIVSAIFEQPYTPYVLYLEGAQGALGAAAPGAGIEYSGQTPSLPFTPNLMITTRERSEDGSAAGPWAGVWRRGSQGFEQIKRLDYGRDMWLAADKHTMSMRIPRAWLGDAKRLRLAGHAVLAQPNNPYGEVVPATHTPAVAGGGYFEIDLEGAPAISGWTLK